MPSSSRLADLTLNAIPSPTLTSSILLNLYFCSSYQRIDLQIRQTVFSTPPSPPSQLQFPFDPPLMDSPSLFFGNLYGFLVRRRCDLDPESRFRLAESIAHFISRQRPPLLQVDARIRIVRSEFVNPIMPAPVIDVSREKGSHLAVKEFIKKGSFECGDERELECSICFQNYKKHRKAVKTECNHVFHRNCVSKWLRKNNTCPLCRKRVY